MFTLDDEKPPIIAWHILTDNSAWDRVRTFEDILEEGRLTAAKFRENPLLEPLDIMAGDNRFIFLGLAPSNIGTIFPELGYESFPDKVWGFGFDAVILIDDDAIVRPKDLLDPYIRLYEYLEDTYQNENDTINSFVEEVEELQSRFELFGWRAREYLNDIWNKCYQAVFSKEGTSVLETILDRQIKYKGCSDFYDCEILVDSQLSLADALFAVKDGKIIGLHTQDGWNSLMKEEF